MNIPTSPQSNPSLSALKPHWQITLAAFLGWFLDAFDQTSLLFTLPDIAKDFNCSLSALGGVLLAQAIGRTVGNTSWGWLSDRYGRKPAFMIGVIWFACFSAMTGLSHSLLSLIIIQFLFGVGFGGEWTASAALLLESVPKALRSLASSLMMSGYEVGYFAAAMTQALILPHYGWRILFFIGLIPAFLSFFIRARVKESPLWLAEHAQRKIQKEKKPAFKWDGAALQALGFMSFLQFQKAAIYAFYPTILRNTHHLSPQQVFGPVSLFCLGSLTGKLLCGRLAGKYGDEKIIIASLVTTILCIYPFLCADYLPLLYISAFIMGVSASGIFALIPHYLAKRFPSSHRSLGIGLSYGLGSFGQGIASKLIPILGSTPALLPFSALGFGVGTSLICSIIALIKPKKMPHF